MEVLRPSFAAIVLGLLGCQSFEPTTTDPRDRDEIQAVLEAQAQAWNSGNIEGFLADYEDGDEMTYCSRGELVVGKAALQARYEGHYPEDQRGVLSFADLGFTRLGRDAYLVLGEWRLQRAPDHPHGRFTLIFRRSPVGFRILHDHSSGVESEDPGVTGGTDDAGSE